jgi:hypothetical protein
LIRAVVVSRWRRLRPIGLGSRTALKRRSRESDEAAWRNYIAPRFGRWPVASTSSAEISSWMGRQGVAPAIATRALAVFRSLLEYAVSEGRLTGTPLRTQAVLLDLVHPLP